MSSARVIAGDDLSSAFEDLQAFDIASIENDQDARFRALSLARKVSAALESPLDRAVDLVFRPYISIAARIAVDLDLFKHISSRSGPISSHELAAATEGDEVFISRVLRLLASVDFVVESGADAWEANKTTTAMASAPVAAGHRFVYDVLVSSAMKAPKYLRETKYQAPTEPTDGFVQYANQTKLNIFEFLQTMPSLFQDFNLFMGHTMGARGYWHEWYDVKERLLSGYDQAPGSALLVDVGGGKGHDLTAFSTKFCNTSGAYEGKLVLQEIPQVLEAIAETDLGPNIRKMVHDFFSVQPIKGARGYFLHHILHDWSDKYCHVILKHLKAAMVPGFSKLLIHELILPDVGAAEIQARFDLVMMTFNGGMERSRAQWTKLLQDAGFTNIQIWEHLDHDGIIEAEAPSASTA